MPSSIFSSSPSPWRPFFVEAVACAVSLALAAYLFVVVVDPWNALPLSPPLPRVQLAGDGRFWFPSLARDSRYDSAVFGSSTSRLLRPAALAGGLGGRFANLAFNGATPYEQSRLFAVFTRAHPAIGSVVIGLDASWCATPGNAVRDSVFPFPEWLYDEHPWPRYRHSFSLHAGIEAVKQLGAVLGFVRDRFGPDGYTNFLPDDTLYDLGKARLALKAPPGDPWTVAPPRDDPRLAFPVLDLLAAELLQVPPGTRTILFFTPIYLGAQPRPGSAGFAVLDACKTRVAALVRTTPNAVLVDFTVPSPITSEETNYWDPLHYRIAVADRLVADLLAAAKGRQSDAGDYRLLGGP